MATPFATFLLLLAMASSISSSHALNPVQLARTRVMEARNSVQASINRLSLTRRRFESRNVQAALEECVSLYKESDSRLAMVLFGRNYTVADARMWVSAALANHRSCLDGLEEVTGGETEAVAVDNSTVLLSEALGLYENVDAGNRWNGATKQKNGGINLAKWSPTTSKADYVVAGDGSGTHRTINGAVAALRQRRGRRPERVVIYVKGGIYKEKVEIGKYLKNVMIVGDGVDKTIVTGSRNVPDGATTYGSATFGVSGDGFWARDITFENTAGPHKHQAVALRVSSDLAVFFCCSIKGYQDTLFLHSLRHFYRDCHIYGTIDFIFGDAAVVLQNCDIFVRKPMSHQANIITAQGRADPKEPTGISIHASRVKPAPEFAAVKSRFRTFLGRPWKRFSRTVVMETELDGLVDPRGWREWDGAFAVSTLYYGEYRNSGEGSAIGGRVKWPGFHVLHNVEEVRGFTVAGLIHGQGWIPASDVPFLAGV